MRKVRLMAVTKRAKDESDVDLVEMAVKKSQRLGATDAVAIIRRADNGQIKFANSEVVVVQSWLDTTVDLFVAFKKKVLSASINDMSQIDATMEGLKRNSRQAPDNKDYHGIASGSFKYRKLPMDGKIVKAEDKLIDLAWKGINAAQENGADRCAGVLHRYHSWVTMASSTGVGYEDEGVAVDFSLRAFNKERGSGHSINCSTTLKGFDPALAGEEAAEFCKLVKSPKVGPEGKMKVLFTQMSAASLPVHVAGFASATSVDSGLSFLKDKIGKQIGSPLITIIDDGTMPEGIASGCADDEGVPTRRTEIVRNGKLLTYLHNTSSARKFKAKNTASAGLISPRPTNVVVPPGDMSREEMLEEMRDGLVVTNLWYSRFQNYMTGDFSTIPRDAILVVRKGEIVGSVKGVRISDNMERMLKGVSALGKNQIQVMWWEIETPTFTPEILVDGVGITKSTM